MNMINLLTKLANLDTKKKSFIKESINERGMSQNVDENVDSTDVEELTKLLTAGEIDYAEFRDRLDSLEHTDSSMRQGEMGMQGDDTPAGNRAWDSEKSEWDDYDDNEKEPEHDFDQEYDDEQFEGQETGVSVGGKEVDMNSLEFDDVHQWDAPDYADAYVAAATFVDGTPLSEIEIDELQNKYAAEVHTAIHNSLHENNLTLESLRYLSGVNKTVNECGIPTAMGANTPATINITAASGSELTGMLKDIMNLAGVHKVEPQHMPIDVIASPASPIEAPSDMASLIKVVSEPEADLDSMNDRKETAEELSSGEKEENRPYDSSPHEKIRQDGVRKFGDANSGSGKGRIGTQPNAQTTESIAEQLYADYRAFVAEAAADEPAEPDADAIAKRKRLQAIKDRQEDERAEKAYKTDSNVRVHHAKYANDVDEGYDTRNAYEKCDPKHPDFKKNYEKYKASNPTGTLADFVAKMKRK